MTSPIRRWLAAALASAVLVAAITAVIALLEPRVPALGLGVLYLLAVVPIALVYGSAAAGVVSVASMAAFSYLFLPPRYSLSPGTSDRWSVLVAFLVTSLVVGQLAARSQRQARRSARLADQQAALRRVAMRAAHGTSPEELFAAVVQQVGRVFPVENVAMARYESDGMMTVVGISEGLADSFPVGGRWPLGGRNVSTAVFETGRSSRMDSYVDAPGRLSGAIRERGLSSAVGAPIVVEGRVWGVMTVASTEQALSADAEEHLASFTELVATAIANAESRARLARLAEEQAALRRVATLVARGAPPEEVFAAVANEVGRLLSAELANVWRYESDDTVTIVASASERFPVGSRWPLGGQRNLATLVSETGRPARLDNYADATGPLADAIREDGIRSAAGTPILVEGRLWGLMTAGSRQEQPLPPDTEARLASFTELVATAIANTEARTEVGRLADEQAALRRVATLVAGGAAPSEVFETVTREVGILCGADLARMERYTSGDSVIFVAGWSRGDASELAVGKRFSLEGASIAALVREAGRPGRVDSFAEARGPIAREAQGLGIRSSVGCPIVVEGRLWGVIAASTKSAMPFAADTESQIAEFTELVATAIANAEAQTELAASRARIVAATDEERRRVVRDLHDGAQQRLVHTVVTLKLAQQAVQNDVPALVSEALNNAEQATAELRELAHGILPDVLTQGGLRAGVDALASRMAVPVEIDVSVGRLPVAVEATAYFVVAEALTNVAKHARAGRAEVTAKIEHGTLAVHVRDDGVGGARPDGGGSGLTGLADRLAAIDGELRVDSPADGGTLVAAAIPLPG